MIWIVRIVYRLTFKVNRDAPKRIMVLAANDNSTNSNSGLAQISKIFLAMSFRFELYFLKI